MRGFLGMKSVVAVAVMVLMCSAAGAGVAGRGSAPVRLSGLLPPGSMPTKVAPRYPKLDAGLNRVIGAEAPLVIAKQSGYRIRDGRIQINAVVEEGRANWVAQWLSDHGGKHITSANDIVQAHVMPDTLVLLGGMSDVIGVRKPDYLMREPALESSSQVDKTEISSYVTEGLSAMNGPAWHSAGFMGQALKVGLVGFGFRGYQNLLGGELPPASKVHYQTFSGLQSADQGGVANAEVVHDIATDAELYLAEVVTSVDVANAFEWMRSNGVDIITSDLYDYPSSPGDGTGMFADIAEDLYADGIILISMAGNFRLNHWQGQWSDPNGNGWNNFSTDDEFNYMTVGGQPFYSPPGVELFASLSWDEWGNPTTDLDLCAVVDYGDGTGLHVLECTEGIQNGGAGQMPREVSEFVTPSYGYYGFAIRRSSGSRSPEMEVFLYRLDAIPAFKNAEGSLVSPADVEKVIAVGAVDALNNSLESYSSRGPTNGLGGSLNGGRTKPDLAAYAGVSTSTNGTRATIGTGVAAMHVAGAAALVWSAYPSWTNAQVRSYLENHAIDMGPSGKDNDYGYGRLYLGDPPQSCTYSISPTSQNFGSNGGAGTITVSTQSGCSWTAGESLSWVTITSGSSGSGSGTVRFNVSANSATSARNGTISVAGKTFSISQDGTTSCSYSISPTSNSFSAAGGTGTVSVTTTTGCSWTASSNTVWITVTSGSSGNGSGSVSYRVASNGNTTQRSGSMTIAGRAFSVIQSGATGGGGSRSYLVAGIAHATGAGGSVWRSTLAVTNRSGGTAQLTLVYRYSGSSRTRSRTLQNGDIIEWVDVATSLFGVGASSAGAIEVQSDQPVIVTARTYNEGAAGTFGQFLPGADENNELAFGARGILPQVKKTTSFRTNVGFVNLGSSSVTVRTKLYSSTGAQLGNTVTTSLPAFGWKQENDIFLKAGVSYCEVGYATVEVTTSGGSVWAYASIVDNGTGDPTTIPVMME